MQLRQHLRVQPCTQGRYKCGSKQGQQLRQALAVADLSAKNTLSGAHHH